MSEAAVSATPAGHPDRPERLARLSHALRLRFGPRRGPLRPRPRDRPGRQRGRRHTRRPARRRARVPTCRRRSRCATTGRGRCRTSTTPSRLPPSPRGCSSSRPLGPPSRPHALSTRTLASRPLSTGPLSNRRDSTARSSTAPSRRPRRRWRHPVGPLLTDTGAGAAGPAAARAVRPQRQRPDLDRAITVAREARRTDRARRSRPGPVPARARHRVTYPI
jgi:hypothetical protein